LGPHQQHSLLLLPHAHRVTKIQLFFPENDDRQQLAVSIDGRQEYHQRAEVLE
jgi:hypothetical protein